MDFKIERIVTDRTEDDRSVFADEGPVPTQTVLGIRFLNLWGTGDGIPEVGAGDNPASVFDPFFPGPGGTRFMICEFPPDPPEGDAEALAAARRAQPGGIGGVFEDENPGMHVTDSIDYGICLDGELVLELGDGSERHITPGTCVVQRGTRHAWRNRSGKPATMAYIYLAAQRRPGRS
jgi:hypothetical protein